VLLIGTIFLTAAELGVAHAQETFSLQVGDQTYEIVYEITGGSVVNMTADQEIDTLAIAINSTADGTLTVQIPTGLITTEEDAEFAVIIDGESGNFVWDELDPVNTSSVLKIEFPNGANVIEIVGTAAAEEEPTPTPEGTFPLVIAGQTYDIEYEITGGNVTDMTGNPATMTLLVTINATSDGVLSIVLPTEVIDAEDEEFAVLVDGVADANVTESATTAEARTLDIDFSQGTSEITITGTYMVPEFGIIAAIALGAGMVGVIIAGWKYQKYRGLRPTEL
jgi:hypothetical protein